MSYTSIHMMLSNVVYRYNHGDGEKDIIFLLYNHNIRSHMVMPINSNIPNDEPSIYCRGNIFQRIRPFDLNPIYVFH